MLTPRWYQQAAIDECFKFFHENRDPSKNPLLQVPTAGGKSLIQAEMIRLIMEQWPNQKILCLAHVKELIHQNYLELEGQAPAIDAGIYSAGLGRKELYKSVTFAGIQSVWDKAIHIGHIDLVFIDEAHLCPNKSMGRYREFLNALRKINPAIRIIGLSATPWRLSGGSLTVGKERLFTDLAYEIKIETLIEEGFLCKVTTGDHATVAKFDDLKINKMSGEFTAASLSEAMESMDVVKPAVEDALKRAHYRKAIMVFCCSVQHAENVCQVLTDKGVSNRMLTGKTPKKEREKLIDDFKAFKYRVIVSVDTITTGFNAKNADCMICLRPTQSSALWVQMVGRIMRTHETKTDALLLDYGGNIERHGPINKIKPPPEPEAKKVDAKDPVKKCPECKEIIGAEYVKILLEHRELKCPNCGQLIKMQERKPNHEVIAARGEVISSSEFHHIIRVQPDKVFFHRHQKPGGAPSIRVEYLCGLKTFKEWLNLEHSNEWARSRAKKWFTRAGMQPPASVGEALQMAPPLPKQLIVDTSGKYPKVLDSVWQ